MAEEPKPGSREALDAGCICPVIDNAHGRGFGEPPQFWIVDGCPIHRPATPESAVEPGPSENQQAEQEET